MARNAPRFVDTQKIRPFVIFAAAVQVRNAGAI
jgi:hypothetical protein